MTDVIKRSVTQEDMGDVRNGGGVPTVINLYTGEFTGLVGLPSTLPVGWSYYCDRILRSTVYHEDMWAGAVRKAITKEVARGFTCEDDGSKQRKERSQELLLQSDAGQGWVTFGEKILRDFLLTDNGAFVEIVRSSTARGSRIIGLMHLPSSRCLRTGDAEYPVIYTDLAGNQHAMRDYQVMCFSDLPRSDLVYYNVGFCAARAAYHTVYKLAGMERYFTEKITGSRALSIKFLKGLNKVTLDNAIAVAGAGASAKGYSVYMGNIIVPIPGEVSLELVDVPLATVPDGFDPELERKRADLIYANCLGVPVQDLVPLSGQGLGTGTQSIILAEEAEGYGLAAWRRDWIHKINYMVLPEATTFTFANTNDVRDRKAEADLNNVIVTTISALITSGMITAQQGLQLAADKKVVPQEFIPQDTTPGTSLGDEEKPTEQVQAASPSQNTAIAPESPQKAAQQAWDALRFQTSKAYGEPFVVIALDRIQRATRQLQAGQITVKEWQALMKEILRYSHEQAYAAGKPDSKTENPAIVQNELEKQYEFLDKFAEEIRTTLSAGEDWKDFWNRRADMYGESVKASYWNGVTQGYALPAVPGDGTSQCLTNCRCSLDIKELPGDGNADVYWIYGATEDHCQTCIERAKDWAPLQFRDGMLV